MSSGLKLYYRALLLVLMGLFLWGYNPSPAQAACASPAGVAGELLYDDGDSVMTYCDGTNWIEFPKVAAGGGSGKAAMSQISASSSVCGVLSDATAWCWGENSYGQLGDDTTNNTGVPTQVGTSGTGTLWSDWDQITNGGYVTCGLRTNGTAWCWGSNNYGQLGNNDAGTDQHTPVQVGTSGTGTLWSDWTEISVSATSACGIRSNGTAWCWGRNNQGELGNNNAGVDSAYPVQVGTSGTGTLWSDWVEIGVNGYSACGRRSNGTLWCWGYNPGGNLGNNNSGVDSAYPVQVGTSGTGTLWSDWTKISVGTYYTNCGLRSNGTVWCWGYNWDGRLGNNTTSHSAYPVQVGTSGTGTLWTDWVDINTGDHACGIRSDSTLWCWGENHKGQLGNNDPGTQHLVPVQAGTSGTGTLWSDWDSVDAGSDLTCGIRSNGSVWCWGDNTYGRLGIGSLTGSIAIPVEAGIEHNTYISSHSWGRMKGGSTYFSKSHPTETGDDLLLCVASLGTITGVSLGGESFTFDVSYAGPDVNIYMLSIYNSSLSGTYTPSFTVSGTETYSYSLISVQGLTTNPFDQSAYAAGSSSTPSSGTTGTTSQDDEFIYGCAGMNGPEEDANGTWDNSFIALEEEGTTGQGAGSNITILPGYFNANTSGTFVASKTGVTSRGWSAVVATYKGTAPTAGGFGSGGGGSGCSSPTGVAGMMLYDTGDDVMTYCNGSSWVEAGPNPGNGGAGCSSPSGVAGSMIYDNGDSVLTYCDGANWIQIGK